MLTIKMLCDIEKLKRESSLPESLVEFLEKTFRELHEAYESETEFDRFSLEMYGPIYVLQAGKDEIESLKQIGSSVEKSGLLGCNPEWVEKIDLGDHLVWRVGVMVENDYLFQVMLGSEKASEVRLRGSSFPPKGDWYCARISLVKGNAGGLKPLEGT